MNILHKHAELGPEGEGPVAKRLQVVANAVDNIGRVIIPAMPPAPVEKIQYPQYQPYLGPTTSEATPVVQQQTNAFPEAVTPAQPVVPASPEVVGQQYAAVQQEVNAYVAPAQEARDYAAPQNQTVPPSVEVQDYAARQQADAARVSIDQIHDSQLSGIGYETLESEEGLRS